MTTTAPEAPAFPATGGHFDTPNHPRPDVAETVITTFHPDATDLRPWFGSDSRLHGWTYRTDAAGGPWSYLGFDGLLSLLTFEDEEAAIHGLMMRRPDEDPGATEHYPSGCVHCAWWRTAFEEGGPDAPNRRGADVIAQWSTHLGGGPGPVALASDLVALNGARFGETD